MTPQDNRIRFQLGTVVATVGALHVIGEDHHLLAEMLRRHRSGDWGDLSDGDKKANEAALKHGSRILSSYQANGEKLWVITESDRSATTVLTPGEY